MEEIIHKIKILNSYSLSQAKDKARHQESLLNALFKRNMGQKSKGMAGMYV